MVMVPKDWLLDEDHTSCRRRREVNELSPASHLQEEKGCGSEFP
jgi:hypothetical protein